jgi:hypothetical protein
LRRLRFHDFFMAMRRYLALGATLAALTQACPGTIPADFQRGPPRCTITEPANVPEMIIAPRCGQAAGCHNEMSPAQGLDLVSPGVAQRLVGVTNMGGCRVRPLVMAEDRTGAGLLIDKLRGSVANCGAQMPSGGTAFTRQEVDCVRAWVAEIAAAGAPDAGGGGMDATTADTAMPPRDGGSE